MNSDNISWLTTVPASDGNFKNHLQVATVEEIKEALSIMDTNGVMVRGNATKITALKRELRKKAKKNKMVQRPPEFILQYH